MWPKFRVLLDNLVRPCRRHLRSESRRFDQAVINATCFYRNRPQLAALAERLIPAIAELTARPVRIAVHAGSIGCEAISLAMACALARRPVAVEVWSFDIDPAAIAHARAGVYDDTMLDEPGKPGSRLVPDAALQSWFLPRPDGRWSISPALHREIRFAVCDMTDAAAMRSFGRFDLVLCQNALLHLTPQAAQKSLAHLQSVLSPYGAMVLGGTPPDLLERLIANPRGELQLRSMALDDRAVYDAWSGRQALWRLNPLSHLGLPPYDAADPARAWRYGHVFVRPDSALAMLLESSRRRAA